MKRFEVHIQVSDETAEDYLSTPEERRKMERKIQDALDHYWSLAPMESFKVIVVTRPTELVTASETELCG